MTINPFILHGEEITPVRKLLYLKAFAGGGGLSEYEVTGNPVAFSTNVQKPLSAFTIPFLPVQSGTGDPSPDNIRPITGWTGLTAWRTGINLFDKSTPIQYAQYYNGVISTSKNRIMTDFIPIVEGETYTFSVPSDNEADLRFFNYALCDKDKNWLGGRTENGESSGFSGQASHTFTVNIHGSKYVRLILRDKINRDTLIDDRTLQNADVQLEVGNTATPYTEYAGASYPVTFPDGQTVYGGTLDATTGVLTVEYASVDMGNLTWTEGTDATGKYFKTNIPGIKGVSGSAVVGNLICSAYKTVASNAVADLCIAVGTVGGGSVVYCRNLAYSNAQDFTSAVNGQTIVYELATPYEIPLDPITIQTLIGDNTIWTDTNGENTIRYKKKG